VRVKSRWFKREKVKSAEEIGAAMAYLAWRIAYNAVQRMLVVQYDLATDQRRFAIIGEMLSFLVQGTDRFAFERLDDDQRSRCINAMASRLADTMEDNQTDRHGPGDYRPPFLALVNERTDVYADFSFKDDEPGFKAIRYLGERIEALAEGQEARWMKEQIMEIEAVEMIKLLRKGWDGYFDIEMK
jgi:hypothetical protein